MGPGLLPSCPLVISWGVTGLHCVLFSRPTDEGKESQGLHEKFSMNQAWKWHDPVSSHSTGQSLVSWPQVIVMRNVRNVVLLCSGGEGNGFRKELASFGHTCLQKTCCVPHSSPEALNAIILAGTTLSFALHTAPGSAIFWPPGIIAQRDRKC